MAGSVRATAAILAAMFLLAACQPSQPGQPTPTSSPSSPAATPTPTFMCTPEAGGEASPCSEAQYDEMKAKDALYEEAEAVYRTFWAENVRISRAGGVKEPTEVMLQTSSGQFLDNALEIFRDMASKGLRARGDDPSIFVARAPGVTRDGSEVALVVCIDPRAWAFYRGEERISEGRTAEDRVYLATRDGSLKLVFVEGRWVKSCG